MNFFLHELIENNNFPFSIHSRKRDLEYGKLTEKLEAEIHFGPCDGRNVYEIMLKLMTIFEDFQFAFFFFSLDVEVQDLFIRLLALWYDSQRKDDERHENDTYCKMVEDILINKTRTVYCDIYV